MKVIREKKNPVLAMQSVQYQLKGIQKLYYAFDYHVQHCCNFISCKMSFFLSCFFAVKGC